MKPGFEVAALWFNDGTAGFALTHTVCHMDIPLTDEECIDLSEIVKLAEAHVCPEPVRRHA